MTAYDIVCIHTIVGYPPAHQAHFSTGMDGAIFQSRDTIYQSAANYEGNHRIIAIENADMPPRWTDVRDLPDFSEAQVESIARILVWCHRTHGIPLVPCPDSRPGSRGIAYHRQGIDGNFAGYAYPGRVPGGEKWSLHFGKVCPTDRRIRTLLTKIIPLAQSMVKPAPPKPASKPDPKPDPVPASEDDMPVQPYRFFRFKDENAVWLVPASHESRFHVSSPAALRGHQGALFYEAVISSAKNWSAEVTVVDRDEPLGLMLADIPIVTKDGGSR